MDKNKTRHEEKIDYLSLFKKSLAASFSVFIFGANQSYAELASSNITAGNSYYNTQINHTGNQWNITGGISKGSGTNQTIFHNFGNFKVANGDIVNYIINSKYTSLKHINLVNNQIIIEGIFNSRLGSATGNIGGNVVFISPGGLIVGSTGIMNVGSLQLITPLAKTYTDTVNLKSNISIAAINKLTSDSTTSNTQILGKIFSSGAVNIADGQKMVIGNEANIVSGFNASGFAKSQLGQEKMSEIVNTEGLVNSEFLDVSGGNIKLVAKEIGAELPTKGGAIQSTGKIELNTPGESGATKITNWAEIQAGGNVTIGVINKDTPTASTGSVNSNNKITSKGTVSVNGYTVNINDEISAQKSASINASTDAAINANITGKTGTEIYAKANIDQGAGVQIKNTGTGNILIDTVNYSQGAGAALVNEGTGNISIDAPGTNDIQLIEAKDGYVDISARKLTINNKIAAKGDINVVANNITQTNHETEAIVAGGNASITATGAIGSAEHALNIDVAGDVSVSGSTDAPVDANIKQTNANGLKLSGVNMINALTLESDNGIEISNNVNTISNIKLTSKKGIAQSEGTTIKSTNGAVTLDNSGEGSITTSSINAQKGAVKITNTASGGGTSLTGTIKGKSVDITSNGDILQNDDAALIESMTGINLTSTTGSAGTANKRITIKAPGTISVNAAQAAGIDGVDTDIKLTDIHAGTDYNLATTGNGNLIIGGEFDNQNGSITLKSDKLINIDDNIKAKGDISITSGTGVTQKAGTIVESGLYDAVNGNIDITNNGENGITLTNVKANNGYISVINSSISNGDVTTGLLTANEGSVSIINNAANRDIVINDIITANTNLYLGTKGNINQTTNAPIALKSGGETTLVAENGVIGSTKSITLNSAGKVRAEAKNNINIISPGADIKLGKVKSDEGNVSIKTENTASGTNKNILLTDLVSGNNLYVVAEGGIVKTEDSAEGNNLSAKEDITLIAKTGDIGTFDDDTTRAINFETEGNFTATAQHGTVAVDATKTNVDTQNITAAKNLYVKTTSGGNITVSNEQNVTGKITIDSSEHIMLNKKISATKDVVLSAVGNVIQGEELTGTALSSGKNITINAANAGSLEKPLVVDAQESLNIGTETFYAGSVYVEDNTDNLTIGKIYSDTNVNIKAQGDILQANPDDISITSTGNITLHSENGNIGKADVNEGDNNSLKLNITGEDAKFNVTKAKNVYVKSPSGGLNTGNITASEDVGIATGSTGDINLKGLISGRNVSVTAADSIIQTKDVETKTINATGDLTLKALSGNVGATGDDGNAVMFGIGSGALSAEAADGSVYLTGVGTDISTGNIKAKNDIELTTVESGNITVLENLSTTGNIKLHAIDSVIMNNNPNLTAEGGSIDIKTNGGDVVLNSILNAGTDIKIEANGNIKQHEDNNSVVLNAGNNIDLIAQGSIGEEGKHLSIKLDGDFSAQAGKTGDAPIPGNVYVTSADNNLQAGLITANGDVNINVTGTDSDIILKDHITGKNVTVTAQRNITQNIDADNEADRSIEASENVSLTALKGSIGESGNAIDFSAGGNITASAKEGSVVLNAIDTDINTNKIEAKTNIDLSTQNSGKINVQNNISTTDGYIRLNSAEGLKISKNLSAGKDITLIAANSIESDATGLALNAGQDITISSASGDIASETNPMSLNANGSVTLDGNNIYVESPSKKLTIKGINSEKETAGGVVKVKTTTSGDVVIDNLIKGTTVEIISADGISQNAELAKAIDASSDLTLKAKNGSIGSDTTPIAFVSGGNLVAEATQAIGLKSVDSDITINNVSAGTNINIQATDTTSSEKGNIKQISTGSVSAGGNVVLAAAGDIGSDSQNLYTEADGTVNASAKNVYLGSKNKDLKISGITGNHAEGESSVIKLSTANNDIIISGLIDGTDVSLSSAKGISQASSLTTDAVNAKTLSLSSQEGSIGSGSSNPLIVSVQDDVTASSAGNLYLKSSDALKTGEISAVGSANIVSDDSVTLNDLISANIVNIEAKKDITQKDTLDKSINTVNLTLKSTEGNIGTPAGNNTVANAIDFSASGSLSASAEQGSIVLNGVDTSISTSSIVAGKNIDLSTTGAGSNLTVSDELNAENGYIHLNSAEGLSISNDLKAKDFISLEAEKDININADVNSQTSVTVKSNKNIKQNASGSVTTKGNVVLTAAGDIGSNSQNLNTEADGTVNASAKNVYLGSKNKDLKISGITGNHAEGESSVIKLSTANNDIIISGLIDGTDVSLSSAKGISQASSLTTDAVNAKTLSLSSQEGSIGSGSSNPLIVSVQDDVTASSAGSLYLKSTDALNTGEITAVGTANIVSDDSVTLNDLISAGTININGKNISQSGTGTSLSASTINLKATENIGESAETGNSIVVAASKAVNVETATDAYIEGATDLNIGTINVTNNANLTAEGNLSQDADGTGISAGNRISLKSKTQNIGSADKKIKIKSGTVDAEAKATGKSTYLTSSNDLTVGNITSDNKTVVSSSKGVKLDGLIKTNSADITAQNSITQGNIAKAIEATGGDIQLTSVTGNIGTPADGTNPPTPIRFSNQGDGAISATASNGSVVLKGIDSTINTSTISAKNDIDLATTGTGDITVSNDLNAGGYIKLDSANALTITKSLDATKDVTLIAQNGDIELQSKVKSAENIKLDASSNIIQNYEGTTLDAGKNITLNATNIGSDSNNIVVKTATTGGIQGKVSADGTNVYLNATESDLTTGIIKATDTTSLASNSAVNTTDNITTDKLNITAGTAVSTAANKTISATGDIVIENTGDGLIDLQSKLENKGAGSTATIISHSDGANAGVKITGDILNNGTLNITSNGEKGTNINSEITNKGKFFAKNNKGELAIDGKYIAEKGTQNKFENTGTNLKIDSIMTNKGADLTFENSGNGNLVLGKNAQIAVYSILDQDNVYTGTLNLSNKGNSKNIQIDGQIFGLEGSPIGYITVDNSSSLDGSSINFGQNSYVKAISNAVDILNNASGSINFGNSTQITSNSDINITNTNGDGISIGANNNIAGNKININNDGQGGVSIADSSIVKANSDLNISNSGSLGGNGIKIDGNLQGDNVSISSENSNITIAHNRENGNVNATTSLTVETNNGDILNSATNPANKDNLGLVSAGTMKISSTNGSAGKIDSTLSNIINNGFDLNGNNSINVAVDGNIDASASNELNIRSINKDLKINSLSAKDALLSSINASINAENINTENLYAYTSGTNSSININNLSNSGKLSTESVGDTNINSSSALNVDSVLSRNGSININSQGNTAINEVSAANNITVNVEDEKLSIINLGKVKREPSITPKEVSLTVKDAKRTPSGAIYREGMSYEEIQNVQPNSKLDIYNAYVQDKVTLKADTINAQVYDTSEGAAPNQKRIDANGNEATGFHNANKEGKLLKYDIQGANYAQEEVGSNPPNENYHYDENDKHALIVNLTIGDSEGSAPFGAQIDKLYSDYAFIDTVSSDPSVYADIDIKSAIIREDGIIRNNKYRIDIANSGIEQEFPINKHYNDVADVVVNNKTSFNALVNEDINIERKPDIPDNPHSPEDIGQKDPNRPINPGNNPNQNGNGNSESETGSDFDNFNTGKNITKDNSDNNETQISNNKSNTTNKKETVSINDFEWAIKSADKTLLGSSTQADNAVVTKLLGVSKNGILVKTKTANCFKKGVELFVYMKKDDKHIDIEGEVRKIKGDIAEIRFTEMDKATQNLMLLWYMEMSQK